MKIRAIKFVRPILGRRYVSVALSTGNEFKIKRSGDYAVVTPACQDAEKDALHTVYKSAWEWLNGVNAASLDRGAKVACGRLVLLLDWPGSFTIDTETRLRFVVDRITRSQNIF